jgi:hypothetical protein
MNSSVGPFFISAGLGGPAAAKQPSPAQERERREGQKKRAASGNEAIFASLLLPTWPPIYRRLLGFYGCRRVPEHHRLHPRRPHRVAGPPRRRRPLLRLLLSHRAPPPPPIELPSVAERRSVWVGSFSSFGKEAPQPAYFDSSAPFVPIRVQISIFLRFLARKGLSRPISADESTRREFMMLHLGFFLFFLYALGVDI